MKFKLLFAMPVALVISVSSYATPDNYLFLDGDSAKEHASLLKDKNIKGAQIIYHWKKLEPKKDNYNFQPILDDLKFLKSIHRELFIQIQDRSFSPKVIPVPTYLLSKEYEGGVVVQTDFPGEGLPLTKVRISQQWVPAVQERFQKLLIQLGKQLDGQVKGVNLDETAIDFDNDKFPKGFTCDRYFNAIISNLKVLRSAFPKSAVVQYVNFFPCEWNNDHQYMSRLFDFAAKNHIGLGGPDVVPDKPGQMKNSYPFFHRYKDKLPLISFAIQEPDYTYTNPKTEKPFTAEELYNFVKDYLGATIIFWNIQEPQYSKQVLPLLKRVNQENSVSEPNGESADDGAYKP